VPGTVDERESFEDSRSVSYGRKHAQSEEKSRKATSDLHGYPPARVVWPISYKIGMFAVRPRQSQIGSQEFAKGRQRRPAQRVNLTRRW
jgi:hypothetical protein